METELLDRDMLKMDSILIDEKQLLSSTISLASSLTSPVDSGVQLLDSESDLTSVMSASGCELLEKDPETQLNEMFEDLVSKEKGDESKEDVMNISLNSYELLDYTVANMKSQIKNIEAEDQMHVSLSEEVNESLQVPNNSKEIAPIEPDVNEIKPVADAVQDEQIVFRRQRKKKSKSDTPKKRVSFHEDILNSTKIDDIHINYGFITIEPDVSANFFLRGFSKKPDVVKGRYSWAAEGDAPYYDKQKSDREVKSDIYVQRYSSVSSSSSGSISSSIDEEDKEDDDDHVPKEPSLKMPKSSCLKKTKHRKILDTNIVEEESARRRKKPDTNLLDNNIFGSLKSIFSTSVPLAERGVPEGQEDVAIYSSSHDISNTAKQLETAKNNLRLSISEGFQPNYPKVEQVPANIVLCDSNVYEHKGISYSYEYDAFQKSFTSQKPKSSTVYQMILKEFNFFKKKAKQAEPEKPDPEDEFEFLNASTPIKEVKEVAPTVNRYASSTKLDWSDNETVCSDFPDSSRHLNSPKRRINKANHYAVQNFRSDSAQSQDTSKSLPNNVMRASSSKNSLINRFLRNVTMKKILDTRLQKKLRASRYIDLYVKGAVADGNSSLDLDKQIEQEILGYRKNRENNGVEFEQIAKFRKEIFRDDREVLIKVFPVWSAYTTSGEHKPLIVILTNATLYISGFKKSYTFCNHFVLPFTELNTILIGPNAQTIHISNYDNDMQCVVTTGCGRITNDIIVNLEMAIRRDMNCPNLPAVKQLNMRDMVNLRKAICKQTPVQKDEEYFYYSIINIQECNSDNPETPLGPNKEGPLMFKISETESRWETAYFILKAGVLYMLSSPSHRVPMRVLPLINGACQGARRVHNFPRPHTFQLIVSGNTLHLAAPDEFVASEWLQALVHAASGVYTHKEKLLTQANTLLMTNEHILTVREAFPCSIIDSKSTHDPIKGAQAISCAAISDIVSFRLPSAEQSWCILEFACREVNESGGDWIIYFATNSELENFISTLEMLWNYHNEGECFPLSTLPETDQLNKKCGETYNVLQNSWPINM
ncbi:PREDICTED: uncharacterized protein LOC108561080 isoform X2 [Nicrophorus vespilloides]|uniref:Uncharacterized protein LOC108561080 isoform X2 n=1 Tax=Nicrophorus vespilloides TaxID=110193 RepID=A0ABM1MIF8_NICVS|nr:PREDICTED: uncharacterized protein LOC108561080 isoform X2 [Nicrophorus vespilloides]